MKTPELILTKLTKDSLALKEPEMRREMMSNFFRELEPETVVRVLDLLFNSPRTDKSLTALKAVFIDPGSTGLVLGEKASKKAQSIAMRLRLKRAARLFTDLPPRKESVSGYEHEETIKTESLPLGVRRSLAKKSVKDTIDRLLTDPDPVVIGNLLGNPRLTEREVLKITSKRPNSPVVLRLIATHKKWGCRYHVAKSLAQNPYTPPRIVIVLLEFLLVQDLKDISRDKTLHPQVKMVAREMLDNEEKD